MNSKIVFVHVPKCAGTSLLEGLSNAVGRDSIFLDYGNNPANPQSDYRIDPVGSANHFASRRNELDFFQIAYGHLHPEKYSQCWPGAKIITVLRHPVDRLISHYFYWKEGSFGPHPIRDYVIRNDLSVVEFAELPFSRSYYQKSMFHELDRSNFTFVGRSENLQYSAEVIGDMLGVTVTVGSVNEGKTRKNEEIREMVDNVRGDLTDLLSNEINFYEEWVAA